MIEKHTGFLQCHSPLSPVMLVSVYLCAVFYSLHGVVATLNNKSWLRLCLLQPYESCLPITNKNISAFVLQWRIQDFFTGGEHYSLHVYHSHVVGNFPPLVTQFYEGGGRPGPFAPPGYATVVLVTHVSQNGDGKGAANVPICPDLLFFERL